MAKEVERKFLVASDSWRTAAAECSWIKQFYVANTLQMTIRARIINETRAFLTVKFGGATLSRDEFEYSIPLEDAREMEKFRQGRVVDKLRYQVPGGSHVYEIDVFAGDLSGLVMAEVESSAENGDAAAIQAFPDWIGEEVTGRSEFYNANLALAPSLPVMRPI